LLFGWCRKLSVSGAEEPLPYSFISAKDRRFIEARADITGNTKIATFMGL